LKKIQSMVAGSINATKREKPVCMRLKKYTRLFRMRRAGRKKTHRSAHGDTKNPCRVDLLTGRIFQRDVGVYDTLDSQLAYTGYKTLKFALGVKNLFDTNPPYANYAGSANNFIGGYDISYGDPRGRFVYASVSYSMH
jgi:outer membrane receptor protein involved in Fe transport